MKWFGASLLALSACSPAPIQGPVAINGSSRTLAVHGECTPIALDRVDSLTVDGGKVVVHGSAKNVTLGLPASVAAPEPDRHWALVTDGVAAGKRALTFTHDTTLDDFTIELPPGDADIHYGVLAGDVMVLAWGTGSRSYSCVLTIAHTVGGSVGH
jgi:hypothetical protein